MTLVKCWCDGNCVRKVQAPCVVRSNGDLLDS